MSQAIIDKLLNLAKQAKVKLTLTQARKLVANNPGRYAKTLLKIHQASLEPPKPPKKRGRPPKNPQPVPTFTHTTTLKPQSTLAQGYAIAQSILEDLGPDHQKGYAVEQRLKQREVDLAQKPDEPAYNIAALGHKHLEIPADTKKVLESLGTRDPEVPEIHVYELTEFSEALAQHCQNYQSLSRGISKSNHLLALNPLNRFRNNPEGFQVFLEGLRKFDKRGLSGTEYFSNLLDLSTEELTADELTTAKKSDKAAAEQVRAENLELRKTWRCTLSLVQAASRALDWMQYQSGSALEQAFFTLQAQEQAQNLGHTWDEHDLVDLIQDSYVGYGQSLDNLATWLNALELEIIEHYIDRFPDTPELHQLTQLHKTSNQANIEPETLLYSVEFINLFSKLEQEKTAQALADNPELVQADKYVDGYKPGTSSAETDAGAESPATAESQAAPAPESPKTKKAKKASAEPAYNLFDLFNVDGHADGEVQGSAANAAQADTANVATSTKTKPQASAQTAQAVQAEKPTQAPAGAALEPQAQNPASQILSHPNITHPNITHPNITHPNTARLTANAPTLKKESTYCLLVEPTELKALLEPVAAHAAQDSFFASQACFPNHQSAFATLSQTKASTLALMAQGYQVTETSNQGKGNQGKANQGKGNQGKANQGKANQGKGNQGQANSAQKVIPFSLGAQHQLTLVLQPINGLDHASDLLVAYVGKQAVGVWVQPAGAWLDDVLQQVRTSLNLPSLKHAFFYTSLPLKPRQAQILHKHELTFIVDLNNTTRLDNLDKNFFKQLRAPLEIHADVYTAYNRGEGLHQEARFDPVSLRKFDPEAEVKKLLEMQKLRKVVNYHMLGPDFRAKAQQGQKIHIQPLTTSEFVSGYYQPKNYAELLALGHKPGKCIPLVKETTTRHCDGLTEWTKQNLFGMEGKKVIPSQVKRNTATRFRDMLAGNEEKNPSMSRPYLETPALDYFLVSDLDLADKIARRNQVLEAFAGYLPKLLRSPNEVLGFTVEDGVRVYGEFSEDQEQAFLEIDYRKFYKAVPDIYLTNFFGCLVELVAGDATLGQAQSEEDFAAVLNVLHAHFKRLLKDLQDLLPLKTIKDELEQVSLEQADATSYIHLPPYERNSLSLRDLVAKFSFKSA